MTSSILRACSAVLAAVMLAASPLSAPITETTRSVQTEPVRSHLDSGLTSMTKLSKTEIYELLAANTNSMPANVFVNAPTYSPYTPGQLHEDLLNATLNRLNALRKIAGLQAVALDNAMCQNAQYGAVLLASSNFSHFPSRPFDMPNDFFALGTSATSTSNISAGRYLTQTPDGFMDDSSAGNIPMVGHRRWQLNPAMGKTGFGYAEKSGTAYGRYSCEKSFDTSASVGDYNFIAWPASGNFMNNTIGFTSNTPWSVSLNPNKYAEPVKADITVTITRSSDSRSWTLNGGTTYDPSAALYMNVNNEGYGVNNCIIFRPDGITKYEGIYTVTITGLKNTSGASVDFSYQVDFFDASVEPTPDPDFLLGDIDCDGEVTMKDALTATRYAMGVVSASGLSLDNGDVNRDGVNDSQDAASILRYMLNLGELA